MNNNLFKNYTYIGYFDGACETNPKGEMGCGCVLYQDGSIIDYDSFSIKESYKNSNNVAEYMALVSLLERIIDGCKNGSKVLICGDSKLVINQMRGSWKVKGGMYVEHYKDALSLLKEAIANGISVTFMWVSRNENTIADELSKKPLSKNHKL